ncbi:hypothetical protein [Lutibacter citreus]|uniref:hypothetical protein n=1 Tax=Lutibacter citreus TaxID=2138210 RepID=UPI000DBE56C3|nr:hypothetical protein [Lutibacter citreus]
MKKNTIAIFFSILFIAFVSIPSIVIILDDSIDVSMFYSTSEEEKGSEKTKENIVLLFNENLSEVNLASIKIEENTEYFFKIYSKPFTGIISPPPDSFKL